MTALPAWSIANIRRRMNRLRNRSFVTCPVSRHTVLIAEAILRGQPIDPAEREHVAGSLLCTVESLWKLREKCEEP